MTIAQIDWVTVIGFLAMLTFMWRIQRDVHRDMADIRRDISDLRERMAKVEGLLQAYMRIRRMKEGSHDE